MEPLSLRGYAKHRGVSLKAVQKALASGRITKRDDGLIDPDVSDVNWARNTGPRPQTSQKPAPTSPHHSSLWQKSKNLSLPEMHRESPEIQNGVYGTR